MIKVVEVHSENNVAVYPVEADGDWIQESKKLLHVHQLFVGCTKIIDVQSTDNLKEMLESQWCLYTEFAEENRDTITDSDFDDALELYHKTREALP